MNKPKVITHPTLKEILLTLGCSQSALNQDRVDSSTNPNNASSTSSFGMIVQQQNNRRFGMMSNFPNAVNPGRGFVVDWRFYPLSSPITASSSSISLCPQFRESLLRAWSLSALTIIQANSEQTASGIAIRAPPSFSSLNSLNSQMQPSYPVSNTPSTIKAIENLNLPSRSCLLRTFDALVESNNPKRNAATINPQNSLEMSTSTTLNETVSFLDLVLHHPNSYRLPIASPLEQSMTEDIESPALAGRKSSHSGIIPSSMPPTNSLLDTDSMRSAANQYMSNLCNKFSEISSGVLNALTPTKSFQTAGDSNIPSRQNFVPTVNDDSVFKEFKSPQKTPVNTALSIGAPQPSYLPPTPVIVRTSVVNTEPNKVVNASQAQSRTVIAMSSTTESMPISFLEATQNLNKVSKWNAPLRSYESRDLFALAVAVGVTLDMLAPVFVLFSTLVKHLIFTVGSLVKIEQVILNIFDCFGLDIQCFVEFKEGRPVEDKCKTPAKSSRDEKYQTIRTAATPAKATAAAMKEITDVASSLMTKTPIAARTAARLIMTPGRQAAIAENASKNQEWPSSQWPRVIADRRLWYVFSVIVLFSKIVFGGPNLWVCLLVCLVAIFA
eukprot:GDKJ01047528.1.p1 GENE.GDKJ01047528.1~~GDKJ01047528.1.p1  ORF type:complete len:691 (+),score=147.15 GDKJ01047528.1:241-2073(+)